MESNDRRASARAGLAALLVGGCVASAGCGQRDARPAATAPPFVPPAAPVAAAVPDAGRELHEERAPSAGVLGEAQLEEAGAFASLTLADDGVIEGGLIGDPDVEAQGGFGLGRPGTIGHGSGAGSARSAAVPTLRFGEPILDRPPVTAIVRRYVKREVGKLRYCYERALLAHPELTGLVTSEFVIDVTGAVASSTAIGFDPDVASCVAKVIGAIVFPKPPGGGTVKVAYPLIFRPSSP